MLSSVDLERLIAEKRLGIEREKSQLGLSLPGGDADNYKHEDKENAATPNRGNIEVTKDKAVGENNVASRDKKEKERKSLSDVDENIISPDIDRYIRRYLGLPMMLKAGEYSPNNPLIRGERSSGDALLGLGEYERRRNTLRKIRQQQYREYLDEQAKKKQEAKEKAERERREREERERLEEERERERLEREERAREEERRLTARPPERFAFSRSYNDKVDTGVQTDDAELYQMSCPIKSSRTQAERELSPRTVGETRNKENRRNSCQEQYTDRYSTYKMSNRDKLMSDLRHTYMPSILNADDIQQRNLEAQQEAQARSQFYQQELRCQILEQQRLKEERRQREMMLEQAEMRRMEDQLGMLKVAQDKEVGRQREITVAMKENATDYEKKRNSIQNEIEREQKQLIRASTQPYTTIRRENTSYSDRQTDKHSKLPLYYPKITDKKEKLPYSINIPDNSIFSANYDVESYLRKNLNPSRERLLSNRISTSDSKHDRIETDLNDIDLEIERIGKNNYCDYQKDRNVEKAFIHERPKPKEKYEPSILKKSQIVEENLPIPVLRHSPKGPNTDFNENREDLSEAMKLVDDKWKVPIVQKNILKSMPNNEGRNVNILTQLGSIRRQLQLEQMKLDKLVKKDNE